ncbi:MAG: hypothetical protein KDB14_13070 [Planctomycetales bacterium]|nr:hypothetical protein [Planctomycetales bacterium]
MKHWRHLLTGLLCLTMASQLAFRALHHHPVTSAAAAEQTEQVFCQHCGCAHTLRRDSDRPGDADDADSDRTNPEPRDHSNCPICQVLAMAGQLPFEVQLCDCGHRSPYVERWVAMHAASESVLHAARGPPLSAWAMC